jgi:hypothetical protein
MDRWVLPPADVTRVHEAASEAEALLIQQILTEAGIPAIIRSRQIPGYAEVIRRASGVWGDILVAAAHEGDARQYIDEYLAALHETGL